LLRGKDGTGETAANDNHAQMVPVLEDQENGKFACLLADRARRETRLKLHLDLPLTVEKFERLRRSIWHEDVAAVW
jgi:hypothetical protein